MGLEIPEENLETLDISADQYRNLFWGPFDDDRDDYYDKKMIMMMITVIMIRVVVVLCFFM